MGMLRCWGWNRHSPTVVLPTVLPLCQLVGSYWVCTAVRRQLRLVPQHVTAGPLAVHLVGLNAGCLSPNRGFQRLTPGLQCPELGFHQLVLRRPVRVAG